MKFGLGLSAATQLSALALGMSGASAVAQEACGLSQNPAAIVMNQTGFERTGPKLAILHAETDEPVLWTLRDSEGARVAMGPTTPRGFDETAGENLHHIDFWTEQRPGDGLVLEVCGVRSRPFSIGAPVYDRLAEDALRYFYLNRLGIDLEPEFTGGDAWARAGGFMDAEATCFTGEDQTGTQWPGCDYTLQTRGGWADAGDYGQYVVNGGITVWTLHYVFERLQTRGEIEALNWTGQRVALPESRDGWSEILLEARWQMEFLLSLQVPDGAQVWVDARQSEDDPSLPVQIDGSGLVHHKHHERAWLPLPLLPADADEPRYLYPPSTAATLNLAAVGAQCSRVWRSYDEAFADRCLQAAQNAFDAALRHPELYARNTFDGGGAYGDLIVTDEFYWAATELALATDDDYYREIAHQVRSSMTEWRGIFWANMELLAELSVLLHAEDTAEYADARGVILSTADTYQAEMEGTGYHYPLTPNHITWGSNAGLLNRAMILGAAHDLEPERGYRDGVVHAMDYVLGRNPLDQSYVAGYGARPMRHPHHRFWAEGADPNFPPAPPGALSGGPNNLLMADPIAREMEGQCAAQTCWVDHVDAYALNEVAINWNAALFAVAAYLDATVGDSE